jgi:hypothetical protein
MRKYTQRELLEEGFWSGVGKAVKGVAKGIDYTLGKVAPEVQKLYKDPYNFVKGVGQAATGNNNNSSSNMTDRMIKKMENGLAKAGYTLNSNNMPRFIGNFNGTPGYEVAVTKQGIQSAITIDSNGKILSTRSRSMNRIKPPVATTTTAPAP